MTTIPYIPLRSVAAQMGLSKRTIDRWVEEGLQWAWLGRTKVTTQAWIEEFRRDPVQPVNPSAGAKAVAEFMAKWGSGNTSRRGAEAARRAHNPEDEGSSSPAATEVRSARS